MWFRTPNRHVSAYDDDWEDFPNGGPFGKWLGGMLLPLCAVAYGLSCLISGHGIFPGGQSGPMDLSGPSAVAFGTAVIAVGTFLHCHYFWGNIYHLSAWALLGKIVSLIAFIGGLGFLLVRVGVLGKL